MSYKWLGKFKNNLPEVELPSNAVALKDAGNKTILTLIPLLCISAIMCAIKIYLMTGLKLSRQFLIIGFFIAFLFFIVHELLHALCFPKGSCVYFYYTNQGLGTTSTSPISKARWIFINFLPISILGIAPFIVWLFIPKDFVEVNSILLGFSFVHFGASFNDVYNIINTLIIVPKNHIIQISGAQIFWYKKII